MSDTQSSYSVAETVPSAPLAPRELIENHYTPSVAHPVVGIRDTCQGGGTEALLYGQGPSYGMYNRVQIIVFSILVGSAMLDQGLLTKWSEVEQCTC